MIKITEEELEQVILWARIWAERVDDDWVIEKWREEGRRKILG